MIALVDGDVLLYMSLWNSENLKAAKTKFHEIFNANLEAVFADTYAMAFGGPNNFRDTLYPMYKKSKTREKSREKKAEWFDELKDYMVSLEGSVLCTGFEADDQLRIWHLEAEEKGVASVIVSIDKDLDCIPGLHYNPRNQLSYNVTTLYAERCFWRQMLTGDSIDNIPGVKGIGPKRAEALVSECNTIEDFRKVVFNSYELAYGKDGFNNMLMNGKLLHIWRYYGDHFVVEKDLYDSIVG